MSETQFQRRIVTVITCREKFHRKRQVSIATLRENYSKRTVVSVSTNFECVEKAQEQPEIEKANPFLVKCAFLLLVSFYPPIFSFCFPLLYTNLYKVSSKLFFIPFSLSLSLSHSPSKFYIIGKYEF